MRRVFISHYSGDKYVVNTFIRCMAELGIPQEEFFCSSLPGNDVNYNIPQEIREALSTSRVSIAFLSKEFYRSAYCMNEEGILWYMQPDIKVIPIALYGLKPEEMRGFIDSNYRNWKLDSLTDVQHIYQLLCETLSLTPREETDKCIESLAYEYKRIADERKQSNVEVGKRPSWL